MSKLLKVLQAAAAVGFDAPKCAKCWRCRSCGGTGTLRCACRCDCYDCDGTGVVHKQVIVHTDEHGDEETELVPRTRSVDGPDPKCLACHGTGLDASDPERLIGRAIGWLKDRMVQISIATYRGGDIDDLHMVSVTLRDSTKAIGPEEHEDTPTGLATALLRLVARVGGAA